MKPRKILAGVLATAALAVLATPALAQGGMDAPSVAVAKVRTTYIEALNNKDPQTIADLYATDGQFMGADGVLHSGRDAIARAMSEAAPTWGHFVTYPGELIVSGNTAWEMGRGVQHITVEDGSTIEVKNQYMVILGLEEGAWMIKAAIIAIPPPEM
ncbi:MAG: nuclear transport factor 2 family protein [Gemmatimonadales bacterium]